MEQDYFSASTKCMFQWITNTEVSRTLTFFVLPTGPSRMTFVMKMGRSPHSDCNPPAILIPKLSPGSYGRKNTDWEWEWEWVRYRSKYGNLNREL